MTNGLNGAVNDGGDDGHVDAHGDDDSAAAGQSGASVGANDGDASGADGQTSGNAGADGAPGDDIPEDATAREKRYRLELRAAETERDGLRGERDALRAQIAAGMIPDRSAVGIDLLLASGVDVGDLVGDDGAVDAAKVVAAVEGVEERYGLGRRVPAPNPMMGRPLYTHGSGDAGSSLADAFRPK